jgi:hypothetical protein
MAIKNKIAGWFEKRSLSIITKTKAKKLPSVPGAFLA